MSLTSFSFILFALALTVIYFVVPKRGQWIVLLAGSFVFYALCARPEHLIYIVFTALTSWLAGCAMARNAARQKDYLKAHKAELSKEEKSAYKKKQLRRRRLLLAGALLANLAVLCFFKYFNFLLANVNRLLPHTQIPLLENLIIPLGISFYTFQTIGSLVDIYWQKREPERNFFRYLLFVSFFPQLTQGPISRYGELAPQLFAEHSFSYHDFSYGCQRMLWGYFKKMVIADRLIVVVSELTSNYAAYSGPAVLIGVFLYALQIYADFSGYMDIVCGLSQIWGIRLTENFNRPYFSKSIAEYWRRWHISLGVWFKDYLYYPIAVTKFSQRLGKTGKRLLGAHVGKLLPATFALVIVWLTTGLWHGASWAYIVWGGVNGLIIIFSMQAEPLYEKAKRALHIDESAWLWRAFQTLRTFVLVCLIKVFPETGSLAGGFGLWRQIFTNWHIPTSLAALQQMLIPAERMRDYALFAAAALILFAASMLQRRQPLRELVGKWPLALRYALFVGLFFAIIIFGVANGTGDFLYAQF